MMRARISIAARSLKGPIAALTGKVTIHARSLKGRSRDFRRAPKSVALEIGLAFFEKSVYRLGVVAGEEGEALGGQGGLEDEVDLVS